MNDKLEEGATVPRCPGRQRAGADARGLIVPEDLAGYAFPHDVRVSADGSRAFFRVTRVDMPNNRYHTDIWTVDDACADLPSEPRRLTTSGEEGAYDLLDDGDVLFVSRRRRVTPEGEPRADAPEPGTDLFRISPDGGEAQLAACLPGLAVRDWAQLDEGRLVLCCRPLFDEKAPVVEVEDVSFYENGGTYTSGTRWGLYLLDLAALPADRVASRETLRAGEAGLPALALLTRADEDVDSWTLASGRTHLVFASRSFAGLRPATNELWSLDVSARALGAAAAAGRTSSAADPARASDGGATGETGSCARRSCDQHSFAQLAGPSAPAPRLELARTRLGDARLRRSGLLAYDDGVLYLASDLRSFGVNEDPHPWFVPADGSAPERPFAPLADAPDLYYGCAVGGDSSYGGGRDAVVVGDESYWCTTEFDRAYVRRMGADGVVRPAFDLPAEMAYAKCLDTADGRTFWLVAASERGLPEVWRATLPAGVVGAAGEGDTGEGATGEGATGEGDSAPSTARPASLSSLDAATPAAGRFAESASPAFPCAPGTRAAGVSAEPAPVPGLVRVTHLSDALAGRAVSVPEPFAFESGGDTLTGYLMRPAGYEPGRRYPGVLEIHGGPKGAYGAAFSQEMQCLAAQGYFVFFTNPHGAAGHGVRFSDIRGDYGGQDYADLMALTDAVLARCPDVDPDRLAVMGGSYGGFMTNWVIGHTDRFRCANSQRSIASFMTKSLVSDIGTWVNMAETTEGPAYDPAAPEGLAFAGDNPRKLWEQSPLAYADRVKTPTLFLHSDHDYRCPLEEGMQMYTALALRGVPTRLVIFKGEAHGLCRTGKPQNRVRRLREILAWYRRWLG